MNRRKFVVWEGWARAGLIFPLLLLSVSRSHGGEADKEVYRKTVSAVVGIECKAPAPQRQPDGTVRHEGDPVSYMGTGSFIHSDGYILTSTNVVPPGAESIRICRIEPREILEGRLVGTRVDLEMSLIQVEGEAFPHLPPLSSTSFLRFQDRLYTFGNAFNCLLQSGVPAFGSGRFSGRYSLDRFNEVHTTYLGEVLELTSSVVQGCDGGPVITSDGKLAGIMSLNFSHQRWLGTAIPIERMLPQLAEWMEREGREFSPASAPPPKAAAEWNRWHRAVVHLRKSGAEAKSGRGGKGRPRDGNSYASMMRQRPEGGRSGVYVDKRGYVLTSRWNVSGASDGLEVVLEGGKSVSAEVVLEDKQLDLALLKTERPLDLPVVEWGSRFPGLGGSVTVLGRALSEEIPTATEGIVSAEPEPASNEIQVEVPLNFGNTGGLVLNALGEPIGIPTGIHTRNRRGQNSGVGTIRTAEGIWIFLSTHLKRLAELPTWGEEALGRADLQKMLKRVLPAYAFIARAGGQGRVSGASSGVLIGPDGFLLTCDHVVRSADPRETGVCGVLLTDGREFEGKVVGRDPFMDIAVLRIEGEEPFPFVAIGDSESLAPGEDVVALGAPFAVGVNERRPSVSLGTVSALHVEQQGHMDAVMTDCPINPGNSGGPLFNLSGELVGINSMMGSRFGVPTSNGASYSVSTNQILRFLPFLKEGKSVPHGRIGGVQWEEERTWGEGVRVMDVLTGSLADRAGLRPGDRIAQVDRYPVFSKETLHARLSVFPAGQEVELTCLRGEKRWICRLVTNSFPPKTTLDPRKLSVLQRRKIATGFELDPREKLRLVVGSVVPNSPANQAGLKERDVLVRMDGYDVMTPTDFQWILIHHTFSREPISLVVEREGMSVPLTLPVTFQRK